AAKAPAESSEDGRRDGRPETSIDCPGPPGRWPAPGWRASENPARGMPPRARSRAHRSAHVGPLPVETRESPHRNAGATEVAARRKGPTRPGAIHCAPAAHNGGRRTERKARGRARKGLDSLDGSTPGRLPRQLLHRSKVDGTRLQETGYVGRGHAP